MEYRDKSLRCADCGQSFVFTAGEQRFYATKNFQHEPRRCKACKTRRDGRGPSSARAVAPTPRQETTTACAQCGRETTVPFKPVQDRPVYCRDCFKARKSAGPAR